MMNTFDILATDFISKKESFEKSQKTLSDTYLLVLKDIQADIVVKLNSIWLNENHYDNCGILPINEVSKKIEYRIDCIEAVNGKIEVCVDEYLIDVSCNEYRHSYIITENPFELYAKVDVWFEEYKNSQEQDRKKLKQKTLDKIEPYKKEIERLTKLIESSD